MAALVGRKHHLQMLMAVTVGKVSGVIEAAVLAEVAAKLWGPHLRRRAILAPVLLQRLLPQHPPRKRKGDQVVWLRIFCVVPCEKHSGL